MIDFNHYDFYLFLLKIYLDGATIKSISDNTMVNPGDEAKLSCTVDGKIIKKKVLGKWMYFIFLNFDYRESIK